MPRNGTVAYVRSLPNCDICALSNAQTPASYDAKTTTGPWANICENHTSHMAFGPNDLGVGKGQRLEVV